MGEQVQQVDGGMAGIGQSRKGHVAKFVLLGGEEQCLQLAIYFILDMSLTTK